MNRILVIGGTGTVGRQVLSRLEAVDAQVRAMARNPGAARFPPQVEVVRGDLTLPDALDSCLEGIDSVFLVEDISRGCGRDYPGVHVFS